MKNKFTHLTLFLLLSILIFSCKKEEINSRIKLQGIVLHTVTKEPISQMDLKVRIANYSSLTLILIENEDNPASIENPQFIPQESFGETLTDDDGKFSFDLPLNNEVFYRYSIASNYLNADKLNLSLNYPIEESEINNNQYCNTKQDTIMVYSRATVRTNLLPILDTLLFWVDIRGVRTGAIDPSDILRTNKYDGITHSGQFNGEFIFVDNLYYGKYTSANIYWGTHKESYNEKYDVYNYYYDTLGFKEIELIEFDTVDVEITI